MYNKVIVFEGIDGSGKSFHLNAASNYLKKKKIKHIKLREPGGSKNSEKLRKLLLSNKSDFEKKTDLLIYLSARSENFHKIIQPNLKKKVILIDRFVDSTIAYQHYGFGINKNIINLLNKFILVNFKVDLPIPLFPEKINLLGKLPLKDKLTSSLKLSLKDNNLVWVEGVILF